MTAASLLQAHSLMVAQTVKNLPAVQETQVQSLNQKDPLQKGMVTHCSILVWEFPMNREDWQATVGYSSWGHKESDTTE